MEEQVTIPDDITVSQDGDSIVVESDSNEIRQKLEHPQVAIEIGDDTVTVRTDATKRDIKAVVGTYSSKLQNMIEGVQEPYEYKLKTVYAHFPMSVKVEGNEVVIQNFIGERSDRRVEIMDGVSVEINDDEITVTGPDKEKVSQTAARIEQECYKGTRDPRKFQDGIYITSKGE
ncbi:MAG: 50S ribosomal protein L6 [Candidatus Nanohaloarchaea archaeon]|nr:50S ribosomal protein L6 [Candidatus Nanohaloarchaea archaeon]